MAYVYILRSGNENLFKVCKSDDVRDRMRELSTANPRLTVFEKIETEDEADWEQYLHKRLRSRQARGSSAKEFFEITPEALKTVIQEAREFLPSFLEMKRAADCLANEKSTDRMVAPGMEDLAIYQRLLEVREQEDRCHYERLHLENKLKLVIGTAAGLEGIATWKTLTKQRFNQAAFKRDRSELFQEYSTTAFERRFIPRAIGTLPDPEEEDGSESGE